MRILVAGEGVFLGLRKGVVLVKRGGETVERVPLADVERIIVATGAAAVSVRLLVEAARLGVPVVFVSRRSPDAVGVVLPGVTGRSPAKIVAQAEWRASPEKRLRAARWFVRHKLLGRAWLLKRLSRTRGAELRDHAALQETLAAATLQAGSIGELMSIEADAGRRYWWSVRETGLLPGLQARRPRGGDPWNSALDLLYALLRAWAHRSLSIAGLYPYMGFLHRDEPGRASLVFDYMEPYRWLAEWTLIKLAGRGWEPSVEPGTGRLTRDSVARIVSAWDRMLEQRYPGQRRSVAKTIEVDAWRLGEALLEGWDWEPSPRGPW